MVKFEPSFWDERYSSEKFVYGTEPNEFFKEQLNKISSPGKLLMPGEGEGRNAVYAAKCGWIVDAYDQSSMGKKKAMRLAAANDVKINYQITNLFEFIPDKNNYDAAAIIFIHLGAEFRNTFNKKIIDALKPGGKIILELFSKNQFGKASGGPQDLNALCSIEDIKKDFASLKTIFLKEENININEGEKHSGEASVIRFVGEKV